MTAGGLALSLLLAAPAARSAGSSGETTQIALTAAAGLLTILLGAGAALNAPEDGDFDRSGFYGKLGGSYGMSTFDRELQGDIRNLAPPPPPPAPIPNPNFPVTQPEFFTYAPRSDLDLDVNNSFGVSGRVGYRLLPHLSVEGELEWLNGFDIELNKSTASDVEVLTGTFNLVGHLLTGPIQPYGRAGVGVMHVDPDNSTVVIPAAVADQSNAPPPPNEAISGNLVAQRDTDLVIRFGIGSDFYINESWGLFVDADYVLPTGDVENFDHVTMTIGLQYRF